MHQSYAISIFINELNLSLSLSLSHSISLSLYPYLYLYLSVYKFPKVFWISLKNKIFLEISLKYKIFLLLRLYLKFLISHISINNIRLNLFLLKINITYWPYSYILFRWKIKLKKRKDKEKNERHWLHFELDPRLLSIDEPSKKSEQIIAIRKEFLRLETREC